MIVDKIQYAARYYGLGPRFERALRYLQETDLSGLAPGSYEVEGSALILKISHYDTKPASDCKAETHTDHADIHLILSGSDTVRHADVSHCTPVEGYDAQRDVAFWQIGPPFGSFDTEPGSFFIAFPEDVHQSGVETGSPAPVRKALMKVLL